MILDLIVTKTDDGYTSDVPKINGCESWAHNEDDAMEKAVELAMYYLKITDPKKIKIDKVRGLHEKRFYKLVIDK